MERPLTVSAFQFALSVLLFLIVAYLRRASRFNLIGLFVPRRLTVGPKVPRGPNFFLDGSENDLTLRPLISPSFIR